MELIRRRVFAATAGAVCSVFVLDGCATAPPVCLPETVQVPVTVPCVRDVPPRPASTFGAGTWPGDKAAAQAALADAMMWEVYATKLEVVVAGCR